MEILIQGTGLFIYPLAFCSIILITLLLDRLYALRTSAVMPNGLLLKILKNQIPTPSTLKQSVAGRIAAFFLEYKPDAEALKAYAEIELARLERGFFILEIIIAGAPLLGLLGTVTGLVTVFSNYQITQSSDTGLFVEGIALALTTTIFGLIIALPALIGHGYLCRRIELFSADINLEVERLLQMHYQS